MKTLLALLFSAFCLLPSAFPAITGGPATSTGTVVGGATTNLYLLSAYSTNEMLNLQVSYDGTNWSPFTPDGRDVYSDPEHTPGDYPSVRDPSITFDPVSGSWLVAYTCYYDNASNALGLARSYDLRNWHRIAMIDTSGTPAPFANWAPEFFWDATNGLHILASLATGAGANEMEIYDFYCTNLTTFTGWSARTKLITPPTADLNHIDPFLMRNSSGHYWLWVNQYSNGASLVRYYVAYTNTTGIGATWYPHFTNTTWTVDNYEGLSIVTKPGGGYRAYLDRSPGGKATFYTSESADLYTWSTPQYIVGSSNNVHGTVLRLADPAQRALVMANWGKATNQIVGDLTVAGTLSYYTLNVTTLVATNLYGKIGWITNANGEYVPTGSSNVTWSGNQVFSGSNFVSGSWRISTNVALSTGGWTPKVDFEKPHYEFFTATNLIFDSAAPAGVNNSTENTMVFFVKNTDAPNVKTINIPVAGLVTNTGTFNVTNVTVLSFYFQKDMVTNCIAKPLW